MLLLCQPSMLKSQVFIYVSLLISTYGIVDLYLDTDFPFSISGLKITGAEVVHLINMTGMKSEDAKVSPNVYIGRSYSTDTGSIVTTSFTKAFLQM